MSEKEKKYNNLREIMKVYFPDHHKDTLPKDDKEEKISEITHKLTRRFEEKLSEGKK